MRFSGIGVKRTVAGMLAIALLLLARNAVGGMGSAHFSVPDDAVSGGGGSSSSSQYRIALDSVGSSIETGASTSAHYSVLTGFLYTAPVSPVSGVILPGLTDSAMNLEASVPNPVRTSAEIRYTVPSARRIEPVRLLIFDVGGRLVRKLVDGPMQAGPHSVFWDGADQSGAPVSAGVYFYDLQIQNRHQAMRLVVLR